MADTDLLTLAEVAEELNVTLPRLRRAITRTGMTTETVSRSTRTGTRTAQAIRRESVLSLSKVLAGEQSEPEREQAQERKQERVQERERKPIQPVESDTVLVQELRERLADKDAEVQYLREALTREQETSRNLSATVARYALSEKQSRLIEAPSVTSDSTETGATGQTGQVQGSDAVAGNSARAWWEFWKR